MNEVIRCSSCNKISPKSKSMFGKCGQCIEIEKLKDDLRRTIQINKDLMKYKNAVERMRFEMISLKGVRKGTPKVKYIRMAEVFREELL